jgi:hypothetical protein
LLGSGARRTLFWLAKSARLPTTAGTASKKRGEKERMGRK